MSVRHAPRLAVVEITAHRPGEPDYHAKVQALIGGIVCVAESCGWEVARHAADDLGAVELLAATDAADAVVIAGGEDIHPVAYGSLSGYEAETRHYLAADDGQIALVHRAIARSTPLLGICRGMQIINVALGGTLVQHMDDDGLHKNVGVPIDDVFSTHHVSVVTGTGLARALGDGDVSVQSAHHQGVGVLGRDLVPAAIAPDGLIEAIEHSSVPVVGVQWHPEAPASAADQLPRLLATLASALPAPHTPAVTTSRAA